MVYSLTALIFVPILNLTQMSDQNASPKSHFCYFCLSSESKTRRPSQLQHMHQLIRGYSNITNNSSCFFYHTFKKYQFLASLNIHRLFLKPFLRYELPVASRAFFSTRLSQLVFTVGWSSE